MKKYMLPLILLNLVLLLFYFNFSVAKKEELLQDGKLILLKLAPVDPRSLLQGDYMALRYQISTDIATDTLTRRGYCIVTLDSGNIAKPLRYQTALTPLNEGEYPIAYTSPNKWRINIGAESFFFQEGEGKKFEDAQYGGLKIDKQGNSVLIGLFDKHLQQIE